MEEMERLGENASELINKLSRQLEHARDVIDLFITFVDIEKLGVSEEIKGLLRTKIQVCKDDKENS